MNALIKHFIALFYTNFKKAITRFPITFLFSTILTLTGLFQLYDRQILGENFIRAELFSVCMMLTTYCLTLYREQQNISLNQSIFYGTIFAIIYGGSFFLLNDYKPSAPYLITASIIGLFCAPYFLKSAEDAECCQHNTSLASNILFAILSTLVLCGGVSAILASIGYLFEIKIHNKVFSTLWILGTSLFAPVYMLANTPTQTEKENAEELTYPKGINFIVRYLLCPLLLVYTAILYAYAAKILFQMELPKGNLTYMVASYSCVGLLTYLVSYPLARSGITIAQLIRDHFFKLLLLPIVLLFIAIGFRISEYGVTWQRYLVAVFGLWLTASTFYMLVSKTKSFNLITSTIVILLFIASYGPLSAHSISLSSQKDRLFELLNEANLLNSEGTIHPTDTPENFTNKQVSSLHSTVEYLDWHGDKGDWKNIFKMEKAETKDYNVYDYMKKLGFPNSSRAKYNRDHGGDQSYTHEISYNHHQSTNEFNSIKGYDHQGRISQYTPHKNSTSRITKLELLDSNLKLEAEIKGAGITIRKEGKTLGKFDLISIYERLKDRDSIQGTIKKEDRNFMQIESTQNAAGWKFKLLLQNIRFKVSDQKMTLAQYNGQLLIKTP